jgi:hypothetical protein
MNWSRKAPRCYCCPRTREGASRISREANRTHAALLHGVPLMIVTATIPVAGAQNIILMGD